MTKRDLVMRIAKETGVVQEDVHVVLQKTLDYITEALTNGDHIEFRDFGVFEVCTRKARIGRNPNRPENVVQIPERKVVKFKPGKKMKAVVLGGVQQPQAPAPQMPQM
ncbi:MAG: integration host factor subunit beta [Lentisphaerae bacterium]|nr:integration host factor subunit beta [Lentisphaerota bacterium]